MAARKLQADIYRVLKLVQQGVVAFEDTFEKMTNASNQTTKDKAEADLKTSIKKLQRQRDQIKTWLQSNDIKDKSALMEHRKLIETQMERFKACEKEMKTKAFSKEGLSAAQKLDPKEVAKMEMSNWVSGMVDELGQQIERTEAEVEILRSGTKKKKGGQDGRGSELEALNDRFACGLAEFKRCSAKPNALLETTPSLSQGPTALGIPNLVPTPIQLYPKKREPNSP